MRFVEDPITPRMGGKHIHYEVGETVDDLYPLNNAEDVIVPPGTEVVSFYGGRMRDEDLRVCLPEIEKVVEGGVIDLSNNNLRSLIEVLKLLEKYTVFVAWNKDFSKEYIALVERVCEEYPKEATLKKLCKLIYVPKESCLWSGGLYEDFKCESNRTRSFIIATLANAHVHFLKEVLPKIRSYLRV